MSKTYTVRAAGPDDLDAWWQLRLKSLREHPDAFGSDYETARRGGPVYAERGYFEGGIPAIFAAFDPDGKIAAQASTYGESGKRSHIGHIVSVYTHPEHRGRGLASRLVQECIEHLHRFEEITSIRISVNSTNTPAIHTYENLGFRPGGEEPDAIRTADGSCHNELHMVLTSGARRS